MKLEQFGRVSETFYRIKKTTYLPFETMVAMIMLLLKFEQKYYLVEVVPMIFFYVQIDFPTFLSKSIYLKTQKSMWIKPWICIDNNAILNIIVIYSIVLYNGIYFAGGANEWR